MYGLVNRGVKEFAIDALGESEWHVIARRAGIEGLEFRDLEQ